jgi:hypothetical protein
VPMLNTHISSRDLTPISIQKNVMASNNAAIDRNATRLKMCFRGYIGTPLQNWEAAGDRKSARNPTTRRAKVLDRERINCSNVRYDHFTSSKGEEKEYGKDPEVTIAEEVKR